MPANLENSALITGLEKVSFHSNLKEGHCQRMFKLFHNCTHMLQSFAQNPSSQASTVNELRTSRCTSWIQKRHRNQRSICKHLLDHKKSKRFQKIIYFCFIDHDKVFDSVDQNKMWKILKEMIYYLQISSPIVQIIFSFYWWFPLL